MAARLKTDEEAWLGQPPSPFVLPMLLGGLAVVLWTRRRT